MARRSETLFVSSLTVLGLVALAWENAPAPELPNRIPEAAPYDAAEARAFPPPFETAWETTHNPGQCGSCHSRIFDEWNGSMMSNSWRDPAWRAAFLLIARLTATDGNCDIPAPPDGSERAKINPFAADGCTSRFHTGSETWETSRSGSLLDGFCSRCHMPTNYADNVPIRNVSYDEATGAEHGRLDPEFDPTSDNGTGIAYAKAEEQLRNTDSGKRGLFCSVCHTMSQSRDTPFHNYPIAGREHVPALGPEPRHELVSAAELESVEEPAVGEPNLGYGVGAGAFRFSPHAIGTGEVFGPLGAEGSAPRPNDYLAEVFDQELEVEPGRYSKHKGYRHAKFERAEMCSSCHDVTNPLTILNPVGRWVGGFPIERTYTEWLNSQYADRPGNASFDPDRKRDCQTCHMQQHYGQPGTAKTLYRDGRPLPVLTGAVADDGDERAYFTHHFIGGNAYVPRLIGADVTEAGAVEKYPKLSVFSYSSADKKSVYSNAYWTDVEEGRGAVTQHARLAWDRLRNVVTLELEAPERAAGERVPLVVRATNSGSGHKFPTGFPEGRVAWIAVSAHDLATGEELEIHDAFWKRTSRGVGNLTDRDYEDPSFPGCHWKLPAGSPDPWSYQIKAVATLGDGCPTLDLPYATPLNMVVNGDGLPIDADGRVIDRGNPDALPRFEDLDGDGDLYDDAYLTDTRLRPLPHAEATVELDRYSVVVPEGTRGPVAVVAAIYYQSLEAIVAKKFLGNLADTDTDFVLEPCVLGGACDGRVPEVEPPVVEGAPPVPMEVVQRVIHLGDAVDRTAPRVVAVHPGKGSSEVFLDAVAKVTFSEPVTGVDATTFTLVRAGGEPVPAAVDLVADGTWGLFPHAVFLEAGELYTARLAAGVCDLAGNCTGEESVWSFRVAGGHDEARGDTLVARGFPAAEEPRDAAPAVLAVDRGGDGGVRVTFSEPVLNVTPATLRLATAGAGAGDCSRPGRSVDGAIVSDPEGLTWTFTPFEVPPADEAYCVTVSAEVYDLGGRGLGRSWSEAVAGSASGP